MTQNATDPENTSGGNEPPQIILPAKTSLLARLRTYFLTGIVVTAPISITVYLAWLFIDVVDQQVTPIIPAQYNPETYLPFSLPGLGLVVMFVFLTFIGFITANIFGRTLVHFGERLVNRMPVIRSIYGALKQILETVLRSSSDSFRQVVLIEYPRKGIWVLAFVSGRTEGEVRRLGGEEMLNVFVPTTPNPTSGFLLFVPKKDAIVMEMTVEEAAKLIISAGVISPPDPGAVPQPVEIEPPDEPTPLPEKQPAE